MDPAALLSQLVEWRIGWPSSWHTLNLLFFVPLAVRAWQLRSFRRLRLFDLVYSAFQVVGLLGSVAAVGELFFNLWYAPYYGASQYVALMGQGFSGFGGFWAILAVLLILGSVYGIPSMLTRRDWISLLVVQGAFMVPWVLAGFPVSVNVLGIPVFPHNPAVNAVEVSYYLLWISGWLLRLRPVPSRRAPPHVLETSIPSNR